MLKLRFELSAEPFVYCAAILNQLRCSLTFAKHCYIRFYIKDTALSCYSILNGDCFEAEIITISARMSFFEKLERKVSRKDDEVSLPGNGIMYFIFLALS